MRVGFQKMASLKFLVKSTGVSRVFACENTQLKLVP